MDNPVQRKQSRRELLRGTARVAILGALGVLSGLLLRRGDATSSQDCRRRTPCSRCRVLASCRLPQALSVKRANNR